MHPHGQFGKTQARTGNAPTRRKAAERRQALVGRADSATRPAAAATTADVGCAAQKRGGPPPINRNGPYAIISAGEPRLSRRYFLISPFQVGGRRRRGIAVRRDGWLPSNSLKSTSCAGVTAQRQE
jgi:hypothetical protein